jgi:hypothetical protein
MDTIEVFKSSYGNAYYYPSTKTVEVTWNGSQTFEEYKTLFESLLAFQRDSMFEVKFYLSDIRKQGVISPKSRKWFEQVALPKAIEQGLKAAAVVFDGNAFKRYYLNLIMQVANVYKLPLKFFNSKDEAYKWFDSLEL